MSISALKRRTIFSSLGAFAVLSVSGVRRARAHEPVGFRDIRVDVSRLRASAGAPTADWVEEELPRDLATGWRRTCRRKGAMARLWWRRSRPSTLAAAAAGTGPGGGSVDSIEGVLIVSGPRGGLAAETPLRAIAAYDPSAVDQPFFEQAYHGRVAALTEAFAGWTPRRLGI